MKNTINFLVLVCLTVLLITSCDRKPEGIVYDNKVIVPQEETQKEEVTAKVAEDATMNATEITWVTWEEAVALNKKEGKKIFVDMYTDWCGWCKRMDATTFRNKEVINAISKDFYAVKFDAEQKEPIEFRGTKFEFTKAGRRGAHGLAVALLDGRLGYPSFVYLDEKLDRITISPGFKKPDGILPELSWVAGGHYKTQTFDEFKENL